MLLHSHLSCLTVKSVDKPEVLATAAQAVAVSVEVRSHTSLPSLKPSSYKLLFWKGAHASWVVGVAGCLIAYTVLTLVVIW